jgi:hypothetical protein
MEKKPKATKSPAKRAKVPKVQVEPIERDYTPEITILCQKYIIAEQTEMVRLALDDRMEGFKSKESIKYTPEYFRSVNKWYFVFNDFAHALEERGELVIKNSQGTWWGSSISDGLPFHKHPILIAMIDQIEVTERDRLDLER